MAQDGQFRDRNRPGAKQSLELISELAPVGGDVAAAVVVQVYGRVAEVSRQCSAVVVPLPFPLQVIHAQAVRQNQQLAAGVLDGGGKRILFQY